MISRLEEDVPARNGVPTADQYERAVSKGVAELARQAGPVKVTTLSIISGTAAYTLPSDYIGMVSLAKLTNPGGVIVSGATLIPVPSTLSERYTISGGTITFYPTPTYTLDRQLVYRGGWTLDEGDYDFDEAEAELVLLHGAATALLWQAWAAAQEAWEYQIGDERVSKRTLSQEIEARAKAAMAEFKAGLLTYRGGSGAMAIRSDYTLDAYE